MSKSRAPGGAQKRREKRAATEEKSRWKAGTRRRESENVHAGERETGEERWQRRRFWKTLPFLTLSLPSPSSSSSTPLLFAMPEGGTHTHKLYAQRNTHQYVTQREEKKEQRVKSTQTETTAPRATSHHSSSSSLARTSPFHKTRRLLTLRVGVGTGANGKGKKEE